MNLRKRKWLIIRTYNHHKTTISSYLKHASKEIDSLVSQYKNIIVLKDFNFETIEEPMSTFCHVHTLEHLKKEPTCIKDPEKPTGIDVILKDLCT